MQHVGVLGNEEVDKVAKEVGIQVAPFSPIPLCDMYSSIRVAVLASWQSK